MAFVFSVILDPSLGFDSVCITVIFNLCAAVFLYEGWNFNSGNYLFTADTK